MYFTILPMLKTCKQKIGDIIFNHNTKSAKLFDIILLGVIVLGSITVIIETVPSIADRYGTALRILERCIVVFFTIEYVLRVYTAHHRRKYIFSLYGIIDFLAAIPAYLSLLYPPLYYLMLLRILRVMRVFRILKLLTFLREERVLVRALTRSMPKISVFLIFILIISVIFACFMYIIEGPANGFTDIPTSLYWTIVTLTTVGYGDITPLTGVGKLLASIIMLSGYGIIAVPTGIVISEYNKPSPKEPPTQQ